MQDARVASAEADQAEEETKREMVNEWKERNPGMGIPDRRQATAQNNV